MARRKIKIGEKKRKDNLDPANDEFIAKSMTFLDWAYEHRRPIALAIVLALVIAVGGIITNRMLNSDKAKESKYLAEGLEAVTARVVPSTEDVPSPDDGKDDSELTFQTTKARATDALKKFKEAEGKTDSYHKIFSVLGKASAHYELGQFDNAIAAYETVLASKHSMVPWVKTAALEGLGYALEASGKTDEALKKFEDIGKIDDSIAPQLSKYHQARLDTKKGDTEKAKKLLKEVIDSYADTNKTSKLDYVFVQSRERLLALDPNAEVPEIPSAGFGGLEGVDPRVLEQLMRAQSGGGLD